jgi:hypothetical protein
MPVGGSAAFAGRRFPSIERSILLPDLRMKKFNGMNGTLSEDLVSPDETIVYGQ